MKLHTFMVIVVACLVTLSNSCSMLTHIEVATRAVDFFSFNGFEEFKPMIEKHLSTFQAGATFPDWGYPRAGYHQASEIAHWPPFYVTAAEYLHRKYPKPWSDDGERLAVFLVGATTHMVADVAWHSLLNVSQGFIKSMSSFGFNYDYDTAHSVADLGGDTVLAIQNDLSYILLNWSIPVADIVEIYHLSGWTNVTEVVFLESITELYAGTMALKEGGAETLFPRYASKSAYLVDQFEDYFIGGLDDMAVWTTFCWPDLMGWFVNGPGTSPHICLMMKPALRDPSESAPVHIPEWRFSRFPQELERMKAEILKEAVETSIGGNSELTWSGAKQQHQLPKIPQQLPAVSVESRTVLYSQNNYSYLGYAVATADLNKDSLADLIVAAPGYSNASVEQPQMGCVYFLFGSGGTWPAVADIESFAKFKLCGKAAHDRFGHSIEVLDFNKDGVLDVAVSSPTTNSLEMGYVGAVSVFLGVQTGTMWSTNAEKNITLTGAWYSNFGSSLISGDVNSDGYDDLILGGPYSYNGAVPEAGSVAIFFAASNFTNMQGQNISQSQANIFLNAPMEFQKGVGDHGWWGTSLVYVPRSTNSPPYLIVGGPGNVWLNKTSYLSEGGSISIYQLDGSHYSRPIIVFYGSENDRLGANLAVGSMPEVDKTGPTLAVSLTLVDSTVYQAGQVAFLSFARMLQFITAWQVNSTEWILPFTALSNIVTTRINGDQVFARFGSAVSFVDYVQLNKPATPAVFVGYPLWSYNTTEEGCVCMWQSGSFPSGDVKIPTISASRVYTSGYTQGVTMQKDARFGNSLAFGDLDGDGATDIVFGSTRKSLYSYLGGAIEILFSSDL